MTRSKEDRVDEARRRLLRAGTYVVPAVLSVVVVRNAQAKTSCGPVTMGMGAKMDAKMGNADMTTAAMNSTMGPPVP